MFLYTGRAVELPSFLLIIGFGYLGFAGSRVFATSWKGAVKGVFTGGWAFVLQVSVFGLSACIYALGQAMWYHGDGST